MKFTITDEKGLIGTLSYYDFEKAITFEPIDKKIVNEYDARTTALVVAGTLQIEFLVDTGRLLYVNGYSPKESWISKENEPELYHSQAGAVYVTEVSEEPLMIGAGYSTELLGAPMYYYEKVRTLVVGDQSRANRYTEIASNTIMGTYGDELKCIVLQLDSVS